jgi:hypothetical protein
MIDVSYIEVVAIGDGFRVESTLFDERVNLPNAHPSLGDMGLVHQFTLDTGDLPLWHTLDF